MLTHIAVENFKSITNYQEFDLSTINLLIGPNRSGKSSVSQAFQLLKQSINGNDIIWNGGISNFRNFESVVNVKNVDNPITIQSGGITFTSADVESSLDIHKINYGITITIDKFGVSKARYDFDADDLHFHGSANRNMGRQRIDKKIRISDTDFHLAEQLPFHHPISYDGWATSPTSPGAEELNKISQAIQKFLNFYYDELKKLVFVPTLRGYDSPEYALSNENPEDLPTGKGLSEQAKQAASSIAYNKEHERRISELISKVFPGLEISHQLSPNKISITSEDKHGTYNIVNEGFGVNQLSFLFQQLVRAEKNSTVFIEEPEISLHPGAHIDVCNALIDEIKREPKQLIITTHSEHVLLSFLNAVSDRRLSPNQLKVYYFERENGHTKVSRLPVTEQGGLQGGMKGFFEADMKHMENFLKGIKDRK